MATPVLLDTCAVLWLMNGDPISATSRAAISAATADAAGVFVSPITAWEIATLAARGRIRLSLAVEDWFERLLAQPGVRLAPMPPRILIASATLPGSPPRDPADRIIAASARGFGFTLITRDAALIEYARAGYLQLLAC